MKYWPAGLVAIFIAGCVLIGAKNGWTDETVVHVPGYAPECAAEFAAYWRAEPDADSATHNAGLRRVKEACDGWPWPILDALLFAQEDES